MTGGGKKVGLIIKNGTIVTEEGIIKGDLKIEQEKIAAIAATIPAESTDQLIEAAGKLVLPGVIDAHTHYKMASATAVTADNFETGSQAAACGGVTTFIDYADPVEGKSLLESLKLRQAEAEGHSYLDYHWHMVVAGWYHFSLDELADLAAYGIKSLKIFTTYGAEQLPDEKIEQLLKKAAELGILVTVHAEDNELVTELKESFVQAGQTSPAYHAESRPHAAEVKSVQTIIEHAANVQAPVYFVHVSTGAGAQAIKQAQEQGLKVLAETCPHYLILTDDCYKLPGGQKYIMTPPLRKKEDQEILWQSLQNGTFSCITTDHCAYTLEQKMRTESCFTTLPGIPGSETLLPLIYSEGVGKGRISLLQMVDLLSTNPAKIFGLYPQKGVLKVGSDADITLLDPEQEVALRGTDLHSAAGYTPFEGLKVKGYPVITMLRGKILYQDGKFLAKHPEGKFIPAR